MKKLPSNTTSGRRTRNEDNIDHSRRTYSYMYVPSAKGTRDSLNFKIPKNIIYLYIRTCDRDEEFENVY